MNTLLSRDAFREGVFKRDKHRCVLCRQPARDAHHILERRLFPDGGYYLGNGASVCEACHLACEHTTVSVERVRIACGIMRAVLPPHLYTDQSYDKWGNPVIETGQRMRGELFFDENVQKALTAGGVLKLFTDRVLHPRTPCWPGSSGDSSNDFVFQSIATLEGQRVVATELLGGQTTTLSHDYLEGPMSSNVAMTPYSRICENIPLGWRICGTGLLSSSEHPKLRGHFYGLSIWNDHNVCLNWDATLEWFNLLDVVPVPVLYDGLFDAEVVRHLQATCRDLKRAGWVLRVADSFSYGSYRTRVCEYACVEHLKAAGRC